MSRSARILALLLLSLFAPASVRLTAAPAPKSPQPRETAHYGVYMFNARVGSMLTRTFSVVANGKPAERLDSSTSIKVNALGSDIEQKVDTVEVLDKQGRPITSTITMVSLGRTTRITAKYTPQEVVCDVDAGGSKSHKVVPIPKGVTLLSDPQTNIQAQPKVGQKMTLYFFEPITMSIQKVTMEVLKSDQREVGGKKVPAFLLKTTDSLTGTNETWIDAKGHMLEGSMQAGLRIVREDLGSEPTTASYEPPKDFAVATSVMTAVKLPDARKTTMLRLRISKIPDDALILSDARQQVVSREKSGDSLTATYLIQTRDLPASSLPVVGPGTKGPGIGDAPYLDINDPIIQQQAKTLAAGETDRGIIARRVRAWVKGHMQAPNNVGTLRSAVEICKSRDGVCRDYATLFAAVARAAGVPTRLCSGIVYFQDGFFYHAWVECQLTAGSDGWYALDPTLGDDFVDATHVKFAQGDPSEMFGALRVIGRIQAEILEHR